MTPEHYARVKEIFLAVESVPTERQQDQLESLCGDDAALRHDVLKLLKHHDSEAATQEGQTPFQQQASQTIINDSSVLARLRPDKPTVSSWLKSRLQADTRGIVFALVCITSLLLAWLVDRRVREYSIDSERAALRSNVKSAASEVKLWATQLETQAKQWGRDPKLLALAQQYLAMRPTPDKDQLLDSDLAQQTRERADELFGAGVPYMLWTPQGLTLASGPSDQSDVGTHLPPEAMVELARAANGAVQLQFPTHPKQSSDSVSPEAPKQMWVSFPIHSTGSAPVAVMRVRDTAWLQHFQAFFEKQNVGTLADTFCIDRDAHVLMRTRHAALWPDLGIVDATDRPDSEDGFVRVVDPGGPLADGYRPDRSRRMLPLTEAAARVTVGEDGTNIVGYRDIRGERVVGAWRWLPELELGIVSEVSFDSAYAFPRRMRYGLAAVLLLPLGLTGLAWFGDSFLRPKHLPTNAGGQQVGAYELLEKIGEGGMGYVYRARHSLLKRASAVKILRPDRLTMVDVGRFDREVKLAAQLTSPHTIRILDYGRTDDGLIYFAMEYLDGLTLSTVIMRSGSLSASRTLHFLIQLCKSIEEAHTAGLIHRDIKPENIIITRRGNEADWLILFDFGLAKSVAPNSKEFRTRETIWAGTPMFMSPERVRTPAAVDPRMDVYAIGAVGYFMLTGRPPFTTANPEMIFEQVLGVMPLPPSQAGATSSIPALDAIVMRCLAKSPDDRPDNAAQLRTRLEELAAKQPWTADEANAWWRANSQPKPQPKPQAAT
ncbi:Serine/threonine-protein kinase PknB [Rosistilla ulvae]|uniref:Serine/threonine-protein kinase PknB n=1 Tax=Rosistilla ulvae TaxID=1930277 RepID=A0A517LZ70_9BACT|nr:serine/threonine-protein kinase [Rosistilla ulvae]QDS87924.1 Serine/threonine-protein kinase PknB [Rosistilla ulvae]